MILTHEEQQQLADTPNARLVLVRNTIAAVLQKLAGVSVEPAYKAKPYSSLPTVVVSAQVDYYSRDQLTTAIAAARVQALEEAAKVCEAYEELCLFEHGHTTMYGGVRADAACGLAKEIRRLK